MRNIQNLLSPTDFYRFRHRTWIQKDSGTSSIAWSSPYWVVGVSPFDEVIKSECGHVVHLGAPRFIARFSLEEVKLVSLRTQRFHYDEDLGIMLYEITPLDGATNVDDWHLEAVCAIAYSLGLICEVEPDTVEQ